jgi:hypothetical protein
MRGDIMNRMVYRSCHYTCTFFGIYFYLKTRDQFSHPHNTKHYVIILRVLTFVLMYSVQGFGGKTSGKETRRRWEDNIKMDLQEVGFAGMDWIDLAQDRDRWRGLVNAGMNLRVP